ncbi:hypothetical protein [Paraburkholderia unamae]|uniref:Uncharacterized protein n=1 Tax=Paraburkholderia unamae TaxID=219649 RepID=A0ACC6RH92_9BURK
MRSANAPQDWREREKNVTRKQLEYFKRMRDRHGRKNPSDPNNYTGMYDKLIAECVAQLVGE